MTIRATTVLVVDDDPDIAALISHVLEREGFSTFEARSGDEALERVDDAAPHVVLLDLMMPGSDGFAFLRGWRRLPEPRPTVVAMSAFDAYLPLALDAGATSAIRKPFDLDVLVHAVRAAAEGTAVDTGRAPADDERARLHQVLALRLDAPAPTAAMDQFVTRVARIFDVGICLVSIVTRDRQFWHAFCGLSDDLAEARGSPRSESFCTHAVVANAALVVQDTHANPFFRENVFVRDRGLRFYAGVPITDRFGEVLGTLCLLDFQPRPFSAFDLELLSVLSRRVAAELEWREKRRRPRTPDAAFRYLSWLDEELDVLGREAFLQALQVESLRAADAGRALSLAVVSVEAERLRPTADGLKAAFPAALVARLGYARLGVLSFGEPVDGVRVRAEAIAGAGALVRTAAVPRIVGHADRFLREAERVAVDRTDGADAAP